MESSASSAQPAETRRRSSAVIHSPRSVMDAEGNVSYYPLCCSQRMILAVVGFFGFLNLYALRINLSVGLVCMVNYTAIDMASHSENLSALYVPIDDGECANGETDDKGESEDGAFLWDKQQQGLILGSFFWGYLVTQIPGGWISERYGGKRVFGYAMLLTAIATLLTPLGARKHWMLLVFLRIVQGLGEGVVFPSMHAVWSHWAPPLERSKLVGFTYAGCQIGNVITLPLAALLCDYGFDGGWPSIFYVLGLFGVVWCVVWLLVAADTPHSSRWISHDERHYIEHSLAGQMSYEIKDQSTPWLTIWTSKRVWAIVVAHTCANWGTYTLLTNIPTYMKEVLKFNIKANGVFSAIPYIGFWVGINVAGFGADALRAKGWSTTIVRKLFHSSSMVGASVFLIVTGYLDCTRPYLAVAILTVAVTFSALQYGGFIVNHVDIAPKYAGVLFGISNTFATLSGIFAPYVVGQITTDGTQQQWQTVFYITAAIMVGGAIFYLIFGTGELQSWATELDEAESIADFVDEDKVEHKEMTKTSKPAAENTVSTKM
ncbi:PREDICTED: sialin-like [Priapulus caudatus]|uniref:Sialin-like n=1 Tax=Priapulus caudatus TaxID=37621 RepID=A0ABM1F951_PRICU|nr:PREDICTED: sialin-like [Priapulus caudatus]XP_014680973.1 PREDICTED: sialin-like [Priapulus caudatus]XP_014680974.1 PREDICTED: sialin-like [Priapulus caudatus]XP_014680975.1 PREDICTED: sialin-like [Priapulus caudatus]